MTLAKLCLAPVALSLLASCDPMDIERSAARNLSQSGTYFRDPRTDLCFVGWGLRSDGTAATNVPCTDAVRALIAFAEGPAPECSPGTVAVPAPTPR